MPEQLTDTELNERVARALGQKVRMQNWSGPVSRDVLNYAGSLDACREIIAEVERRCIWPRFVQGLEHIKTDRTRWFSDVRNALLATPRQICEAFCAAVGGQ